MIQDCPEKLSEDVLHKKIAVYLSKYFKVTNEVKSTDKKRRIDMVIIHLTDTEMKYPIGIEVKINDKKRGKDLANWLKQASDYATKEFIGFGKCLIVTCPQVSGYYLREGELMNQHETESGCGQANNIGTFLSQFGVGEMQKEDGKYFRIVFKGQTIWESKYNRFNFANYDRLCR
jgi:hypothetical protein